MSRGLAYQPADRQEFHTLQCQQFGIDRTDGDAVEPTRDKPLSFHWRVDIEKLRSDLPTFPHFKNEKLERAAAAIVADALQVLRSKVPWRRISYSRSHDWYSDGERYRGSDFTYVTVIQAIGILVDAGILVDHDKRPQTVGGSGIQSSFRCSAELAGLKTQKISRAKLKEVLVLKDKQKRRIGYKDTVRTRRVRKDIEKVNEVVMAADIILDAPHAVIEGDLAHFGNHTVYLSMKEGYRVFNNGAWTDGGRLYGTWWQQMKSEDRRYILIGGRKVVELDFEQLHPRMMYAKVGIAYEGDAYVIPDWTDPNDPVRNEKLRKLCKRGWNILLNATSWPGALLAMTNYCDGCDVTARELLTDIRDHHHKIADQFHSGAGLKFQAIDGDMCMEILKEMNVKRGIPCLSVHDSFIVAEEHLQTLTDVMAVALRKGLSRVSGKPCVTRNSGRSVLHTEAPPPHLRRDPCSAGAPSSAAMSACSESDSESLSQNLDGAVESESSSTCSSDSKEDDMSPETSGDTIITSTAHTSANTTVPANTEKKVIQTYGDVAVSADTAEHLNVAPRGCSDGSTVVRQEEAPRGPSPSLVHRSSPTEERPTSGEEQIQDRDCDRLREQDWRTVTLSFPTALRPRSASAAARRT